MNPHSRPTPGAKRTSQWWTRASARYQRFENSAFALASEIEYRIKLTPRGTRIQPSAFDRRVLRLFVVLMPMLLALLFVGSRTLRIRLTFAVLVVVCVLLAIFLFLDARRGVAPKGGTPRNKNSGRKP